MPQAGESAFPGQAKLNSAPMPERIEPGEPVWARDASDHWLPRVADSRIEGCSQGHDFAGAYVLTVGVDGAIFWPLADLRLRDVA